MDRAHIFLAVLLNLFSVQLTFCGTGEPMMYLTPSNYEMRSIGAQPFIQAQFHPASGTIQQGIMLPQEHLMPLERNPEEFYYQERMMPQESTQHQERMLASNRMQPQQSMQHQGQSTLQGNIMPQERMMHPDPQRSKVGQERMVPQDTLQKIVHTDPILPQVPHKHEEPTTNELTDANNLHGEEDQVRAVKTGYEYSHSQTYPQSPPYGYSSSSSSYNTPAQSPSSYTTPGAPYSPPAVHSDPTKFLIKPDLTDLIKPVTGKMAGKLNGLAGLVLSLLGSGKGLELSGIKDLLIDGILRPLLVAKGGIKALISKLSIPIVALLLINLEVLITVWWLWEDCPAVKHEVEYTKPTYPATPSYSNNYR